MAQGTREQDIIEYSNQHQSVLQIYQTGADSWRVIHKIKYMLRHADATANIISRLFKDFTYKFQMQDYEF